eukprot:TRINITY_DN49012_c0_g1_i2.p1 TRINITY_DN49012_c0_g1~~TRINITY_DN49012_c0_g1_i2.p1  ORF type:complete len:344 (+),score=41.77 TRINITY_DN49012_c0_g1_i2:97-1128(+)
MVSEDQRHAEMVAFQRMRKQMPCLRQVGPSCGSTCLAMALEYHGFPATLELIEAYIHPYGNLDLGEVPAELARHARLLGFSAQHYCHGGLEDIMSHLRHGRTVTAMLNYRGGMGHIVNVIGMDRDAEGNIEAVKLRNPWGRDEVMSAPRFRQEWQRMRLTRNSMGKYLPVFDCCFAVVARPDDPLQPASLLNWMHSASVNVLVSGLNGMGGGLKIVRNGHCYAGTLYALGSLIKIGGGLLAYGLGNLIGKNLEFVASDLVDQRKADTDDESDANVVSPVSACLFSVATVGRAISLLGGCLAAAVELIAWPWLMLGLRATRIDASHEHMSLEQARRSPRTHCTH